MTPHQAWIEVKARPEGGWLIIVCVMRPSRQVLKASGERKLVPHIADTWKARTVRGVRRALQDAAALRRRLVS